MARRCVDDFPASEKREELLAGLEILVGQLFGLGIPMTIWIDGSFVSDKVDPEDVDMVVMVASDDFDNLVKSENSLLYSLRYRKNAVKARFGCDAYLCYTGDTHQYIYWRGCFGFDKGDNPKGIVCLSNF